MVNRVKDMDVLENLRKRRRYLATYEKVEINAPDAVEAKTLL